jgi:hypothetical protein
MRKEPKFNCLGFKNLSTGKMYPLGQQPEWMTERITNAFIKVFEKTKQRESRKIKDVYNNNEDH